MARLHRAKKTFLPLAAALALGATAQLAGAQDLTIAPSETHPYGVGNEIRSENGIRYACTGVGKDSREDPRWDQFSAKMVYAVEGGGYLPGVTTRISRADGGDVLFSQWCDGPWLLADLPPGDYEVTALAEDDQGKVHRHQATLSVDEQGQAEQVITFPEMPS